MTTFAFGDQVRDTLSGFQGIIIARAETFNGNIQYMIQPENDKKTEKYIEAEVIDRQRLVLVKAGVVSLENVTVQSRLFNIGDEVQDLVTKTKGIVISVYWYMAGCYQYGIQPVMKSKQLESIPAPLYFDSGRLKMIKSAVAAPKVRTGTGGPNGKAPPRFGLAR